MSFAIFCAAALTSSASAPQIASAVYQVIADGKVRTPDMGGNSHTTDMTRAVIKALK